MNVYDYTIQGYALLHAIQWFHTVKTTITLTAYRNSDLCSDMKMVRVCAFKFQNMTFLFLYTLEWRTYLHVSDALIRADGGAHGQYTSEVYFTVDCDIRRR